MKSVTPVPDIDEKPAKPAKPPLPAVRLHTRAARKPAPQTGSAHDNDSHD